MTREIFQTQYDLNWKFPPHQFERWHIIGHGKDFVFVEATPKSLKKHRQIYYVTETTKTLLVDQDVSSSLMDYITTSWSTVEKFCEDNGLEVRPQLIQ
jgi:hypothetical protein